jgi:putative heme-binding domain-containing protein
MVTDESPAVRLQLALTLGEMEGEPAEASLVTLLVKDSGDYWIRTAALSSLRDPAAAFPKVVAGLGTNASGGALELIRDMADLAVARVDHPASQIVEIVSALEGSSDELMLAGLEGLDRGLGRKQISPSRLAIGPILTRVAKRNDDLFFATWKLSKRLRLPDSPEQKAALEKAKAVATSNTAPPAERLRAIERLRFGNYKEVRDAVFSNLSEGADAGLQSAALNVVRNYREAEVAAELVSRWPVLAPAVRPGVVNLLLSRRPFHDALVTGIENGALKPGELNLDLEQRRTLLRESTPEIQARASKFIGDEEYSNRKAVLDEWLAKLPARGEAGSGRTVFENLCAQCHRASDVGKAVGPDLTSISHRSVEDILYNIIDPNMAINPVYSNYQIETKSGDLMSGILAAESPDSVTLLQANEIKSTIPRAEIAKFRSTGTSLMPEGLEAGLSPQQMRDLIAFLQEPSR